MIGLRFERLPRWVRDIMPLLFWMGLIFFLSSQATLIEIDNEINEKLFFKIAHVTAYAILAWLWWRALSPERRVHWGVLGAALLLTSLYGISDEIHQYFVPGRHPRLADILFDTAGALLMVLLLRLFEWPRLFPERFPFYRKFQAIDTPSEF